MARVLVIDDEDQVLSLMTVVLSSMGHSIVKAGSGSAANSVLKQESVNLIISDLAMPDGGLEFIRSLGATKPSIPVIVMSGQPGQFAGAVEAGAAAALLKPFTMGDLKIAVDAALYLQPDRSPQ